MAVKLSFTRNSDTVWLDLDYTPGGVAVDWDAYDSAVVEIRTKPLTGVAAKDAESELLSRMTTGAGSVALGASGNLQASVSKTPSAANTSCLPAGTYHFDVRLTTAGGNREEPILSGQVDVLAEVGEAP